MWKRKWKFCWITNKNTIVSSTEWTEWDGDTVNGANAAAEANGTATEASGAAAATQRPSQGGGGWAHGQQYQEVSGKIVFLKRILWSLEKKPYKV